MYSLGKNQPNLYIPFSLWRYNWSKHQTDLSKYSQIKWGKRWFFLWSPAHNISSVFTWRSRRQKGISQPSEQQSAASFEALASSFSPISMVWSLGTAAGPSLTTSIFSCWWKHTQTEHQGLYILNFWSKLKKKTHTHTQTEHQAIYGCWWKPIWKSQ